MTTQRAFKPGSEYPAREHGVTRLYSMRFCPYVKRTRLVLEYKHIPFETVNIDLSNKPEWYLEKINCLGLVPALENDDVIIFDSVIINEYLDAVYPNNKLLPSDPYQAAKDKMLLEIWSKVVTLYYKVFYYNGSGVIEDVVKEMLRALDRLENELKARKSKFFGGESPMMIDFNIWPHMERLCLFDVLVPDFKLDAVRFKHMTEYIQSMNALPVITRSKLREDWFKKFVESVQSGDTNYDIGLDD